jgi:hypothetical protein
MLFPSLLLSVLLLLLCFSAFAAAFCLLALAFAFPPPCRPVLSLPSTSSPPPHYPTQPYCTRRREGGGEFSGRRPGRRRGVGEGGRPFTLPEEGGGGGGEQSSASPLRSLSARQRRVRRRRRRLHAACCSFLHFCSLRLCAAPLRCPFGLNLAVVCSSFTLIPSTICTSVPRPCAPLWARLPSPLLLVTRLLPLPR